MFEPDEIPEVKRAIRECAIQDRQLLDDLRNEVKEMRPNVRSIQPRRMNSFSLVASESTNNKLVYDPFYFQLIRVVDSNGYNLCLDTITPSTNTDLLSLRQFDALGKPSTALGTLMQALRCKTLNDLSPMIPTGRFMQAHPEKVSKSWVQVYRDLCEWAVLYDKICNKDIGSDTLFVKDGLLRSKIFKYDKDSGRALFIEMMELINAAIEKHRRKKIKVYFVGLAKHSQVLSRYSLAMNLENIFPSNQPCYARVPFNMEEKSYIWKEYMKKQEGEQEVSVEEEKNKYSVGSLYLVRFGKRNLDPVWAVDLLASQASAEAEIFGYLLMDTMDSFPVPHYPSCLQKALEYAQIVDFDLDILQDEVIKSVREILPRDRQEIIDNHILSQIINRE